MNPVEWNHKQRQTDVLLLQWPALAFTERKRSSSDYWWNHISALKVPFVRCQCQKCTHHFATIMGFIMGINVNNIKSKRGHYSSCNASACDLDRGKGSGQRCSGCLSWSPLKQGISLSCLYPDKRILFLRETTQSQRMFLYLCHVSCTPASFCFKFVYLYLEKFRTLVRPRLHHPQNHRTKTKYFCSATPVWLINLSHIVQNQM